MTGGSGADDSSEPEATVSPGSAGLITRYADLARAALGMAEAPVASYAGLWLLLANLAPVASSAHRAQLADVLGVPCDDAAALAAELLAAPHPTVGVALGAWSRVPVPAGLATAPDELPDQAGLDRWAAEHTRGLIERFPLQISPATLLVLATALVLQPRWTTELAKRDGLLVLDGELQALVDTRAAGPVAVAKPLSTDGVDVLSIIAAQEVPSHDVWRAVDEVVARLDGGELRHGEHPGGELIDGHAWTVRETTETFLEWDAPNDSDHLWRSRLPRWRADALSKLTGAPGVTEIAKSLADVAPELGGPTECTQAATAAYDEHGFSAAAVTAFGVALGRPAFVERTVRRVEITFDRPHAVIAIARGGAWEGVPLVNAWVTPDMHVSST
ncbi:hypothetical protein A5765_08350 [Mycolicibacterium celeriflavum]|uniref:hypothetical protein n=1 Tax=Mycolicibacterium celeriflavum TaxID=1249101 RepID=UPI0007FF6242|nr:hypothetical protein [Mycolicibacterium celeriflavum]OBG15750.1 hypothetical protein A5765_08350 [Mycolicibacterium celeriflavum]